MKDTQIYICTDKKYNIEQHWYVSYFWSSFIIDGKENNKNARQCTTNKCDSSRYMSYILTEFLFMLIKNVKSLRTLNVFLLLNLIL